MPELESSRCRIALFTIGTQGDIRPCIALGLGLQREGHAVRLVTSRNFEPWVRGQGLDFAPLTADFQALLMQQRELAEQGLDLRRMAMVFRRRFAAWAEHWVEEGLQASEDADVLLGVGNSTLLAQALAEVRQRPFVRVQLQPLTPSRHLPPLMMTRSGAAGAPGWFNLAGYQVMRLLVWHVMQPAINRQVRPRLGLRPYPWYGPYFSEKGLRARVLYGFSPLVLPPPDDWPDSARVCGYWFLDEPSWRPDEALLQFLGEGEPPVYVGFGSMVSGQAASFTRQVMESLLLSGRRAVLATGWGAMDAAPGRVGERLLVIRDAPHGALFPRMAAAVHHGGAGTAAAAVRAGIPSVVLPFYGDQPFWARRLQAAGVASEPLTRRTLEQGALPAALTSIMQPGVRATARRLAVQLAKEDGVAAAIGHLRAWQLLPATRSASVVPAELSP